MGFDDGGDILFTKEQVLAAAPTCPCLPPGHPPCVGLASLGRDDANKVTVACTPLSCSEGCFSLRPIELCPADQMRYVLCSAANP